MMQACPVYVAAVDLSCKIFILYFVNVIICIFIMESLSKSE